LIAGVTTRRLAVTLPEELVATAQAAVADGQARSVSAYVAKALDAYAERQDLRTYVDGLIAEHGKPSAEDYRWADEQIARTQSRRRP
jgi:Arc/MetJ-type ribon-helix-helix transcriptional regulator